MAATPMRAHDIRKILESDILTGLAATGERIDEQRVARRFGVSRTPVREALHQLASAGLVELIPNRGAFVRRVSFRELIQMFEVMGEFEAMAGRLFARRATPTTLDSLSAALEACNLAAQDGDPDAYYLENGRFHEAIYAGSGNAFLAGEARRLHQRLTAYRRLQLRVPKRIGQSLVEHRAITRAIVAGEAEAAAEALRDHVTIQGGRFADFLALVMESEASV
jgi:DNA-binding GntR family transcriptional regulator